MRIVYIGNFDPPHSTENDVKRALKNNGHTVTTLQEGDPGALSWILTGLRHGWRMTSWDPRPDFILWTRTKSLSERWSEANRWQLLADARKAGIPVVGYHLDRWWGLRRENEVHTDPFFQVDMLVTADGGHDDRWAEIGVNHLWMPPAISSANLGVGTPRDEFRSDIAFVGSWQDYHSEWKHRMELVHWLSKTYGDRVAFWPKQGQHAIRGRDLNDLYASVKVVVGDSCLVPRSDGTPITRYCSDRIPETLGRGGRLVHPFVEGITFDQFWYESWELGNWENLRQAIDYTLDQFDIIDREAIVDDVAHGHTYEDRMARLTQRVALGMEGAL